jgi:hypothetical protein
MTREKFKNLTDQEQWSWVIANKEEILLIELDNDCTYVSAARFKEEGNDECNGSISMKSYLGHGYGIFHLMKTIGIECTGV